MSMGAKRKLEQLQPAGAITNQCLIVPSVPELKAEKGIRLPRLLFRKASTGGTQLGAAGLQWPRHLPGGIASLCVYMCVCVVTDLIFASLGIKDFHNSVVAFSSFSGPVSATILQCEHTQETYKSLTFRGCRCAENVHESKCAHGNYHYRFSRVFLMCTRFCQTEGSC